MSWSEILFKAVKEISKMVAIEVAKSGLDGVKESASDGARGLISGIKRNTYESLIKWWSGKCIAIIGPTASGKNSLFNRLQCLDAPSEHIQTRGAEKVGTFKFNWTLPDKTRISFKSKRSINVGGETDERDRYWMESCKNSDVIFYIVDITKLNDPLYKDRIQSDLRWISIGLPHFKSTSCVYILVNKVDTIIYGCNIHDVFSKIENDCKNAVDEIEDFSKKILGKNYERISGISPISMTDSHIFSIFFTDVLKKVMESEAL